MFNNGLVKSLKSEVEFLMGERRRLQDQIYSLQGDMKLIVEFLGADFEQINKRVLTKKGGPEKG